MPNIPIKAGKNSGSAAPATEVAGGNGAVGAVAATAFGRKGHWNEVVIADAKETCDDVCGEIRCYHK